MLAGGREVSFDRIPPLVIEVDPSAQTYDERALFIEHCIADRIRRDATHTPFRPMFAAPAASPVAVERLAGEALCHLPGRARCAGGTHENGRGAEMTFGRTAVVESPPQQVEQVTALPVPPARWITSLWRWL
jgi:hypothetical protein